MKPKSAAPAAEDPNRILRRRVLVQLAEMLQRVATKQPKGASNG